MKNRLTIAAVIIFFIALGGYLPAEGFDKEPIKPVPLLAQQSDASSDKQSETPRDEVLEEADKEADLKRPGACMPPRSPKA